MKLHSPAPRLAQGSLVALTLLVLAGACCGGPGDAERADGDAVAQGDGAEFDVLPTPYTADEIRNACLPGTRLVFRVVAEGQPEMRQQMTFVAADEDGATVEAWMESAEGEPLGPRNTSTMAWDELRDHALVPRGSTRERTTVTVPQGTHEAWHYVESREEGGQVLERHMWFADRFPGPPVRSIEVVDGEQVLLVELLALAMP